MVGRGRGWLNSHTLMLWTLAFWLLCLLLALRWGPVHTPLIRHPASSV